MSLISIVLPVYNGEKYLKESLDSILTQTWKDWEVICVDDCSVDSTAEILQKYERMDSRIRIIRNEKNQKLPRSLNIGFADAKGDFLTWTSDDNVYLPDALQIMHDTLVANEDVPMVVADMEIMDSNGKSTGQICVYDKAKMYSSNCVGACFMYRKSVIKAIGGYDISRFLVEDYDYWLRVQKYCGEILRIPRLLYRYRLHENSLSSQRQVEVCRCRIELLMDYVPEIIQKTQDGTKHIAGLYFLGWVNGVNMSAYAKSFSAYLPELDKIQITRNIDGMPEDFPIALFGAGEFGRRALHYFGNKVSLFIDNDKRKLGCEVEGIPVLSFDEYCKGDREDNIVLSVDSYYVYEIIRQLCEANIRKIGIFCSRVK